MLVQPIPSKINNNLLERICWRCIIEDFFVRIDLSYNVYTVHYWFRYYEFDERRLNIFLYEKNYYNIIRMFYNKFDF